MFLLALLLSSLAQAFVIDLATDGRPGPGGTQVIELPSVVLAAREPIRVLGPRGGSLRGTGALSCLVPLSTGKGTIAAHLDGCGALFDLAPQASLHFAHQVPPKEATLYRFELAPADPGGPIVLTQTGEVLLGGELAPVQAAAAWVGGRWHLVGVDQESRALIFEEDGRRALAAWLAGGTEDLVVRVEVVGAPREKEWRAAPVWVPQAEREQVELARSQARVDWCQRPEPVVRSEPALLLCLDSEGAPARSRRFDARGELLATDRFDAPTGARVEVAVRHLPGAQVELRTQPAGEVPLEPIADAGMVVREVAFERLPALGSGTYALVARVDGADRALAPLTVAPRYWGALRLGLALTSPASRAYTTGAADDDGLAPIERRRGDKVDGELVVGFAPFLDPGGRDYLLADPLRFAPVLGLGLVAANGARVRLTALQSYHLGGEIEPVPGLALNTSLTLRRVPRLPDGQEEGDRVAATRDVDTRGVLRPGLSIGLGITPAALRFPRREP